jgi:hypothetical protein
MGRYDSHKHPFQYGMNYWAEKRVNNSQERQTKSIPCHVVEVAKDFIKVAFETSNGVFTPPVVKIPQSWSQFSREPTQVGNKGYASSSDYYLGGVTGDSGGNTNFFPRGNLTAMSFNGVSHKDNPDRDYDQLTHMAGPNGWVAGNFQEQQQQNQNGQGGQGGGSPAVAQTAFFKAQQARLRPPTQRGTPAKFEPRRSQTDYFRRQQLQINPKRYATPSPFDTSSAGTPGGNGQQGQQQQKQNNQGKTNFNFDKNGVCTIQSKDTDHQVYCSADDGKIYLKVPTKEKIYVGGDGKEGKYAKIMTEQGPVVNALGRIG